MPKRSVSSALVALALACSAVPSTPAAAGDASRAEAVAASLRASIPDLMKAADVPGVAVAVVRGGDVIWTGSFGVANAETGAKVDGSTVFEAASLTKPVVAYGALELVDAGRLDLDKPLASYMPKPYLADERAKPVTARHVLSHTTGFPNWRRPGADLAVTFAPGERFSYSGEGFVYLQAVMEQITGARIDAYIREAVFEPLGMRDSSLVWIERYEATKVYGHDLVGEVAGRRKPDTPNAAASLHTTAADYGRFVAAVLARRGLKGATFAEMLRPQVWVHEGCKQCPDGPVGKLSTSVAWGLGWGLERGDAGTWFWHWGDNGTAKAFVLAGGADGLGVVVFANAENGLALAREAVERALGARPSFAWVNVDPYDAPSRRLLKAVLARGAAAVAEYRASRGATGRMTEAEVNTLGYSLLRKSRVAEAIELFRLNVEDFPGSANVYDSLAEAYAAAGRRAPAVENYRRVLTIAPGDKNATAMLARLEAPEVAVARKLLEAYAGRYTSNVGALSITHEGGRLYGELRGWGRSALVARSETRFESLAGYMTITFARGDQGRTTHATLEVFGQTTRADRTEPR